MKNGRPITGRIRHEFHIGTRAPGKGDLVRLSYPAVSTDTREARLTVRDRESDTRTEIPAGSWEFADVQSIRLLPQGSLFALFKIYELWYEATGSKVLGLGFASVRDLAAFLRYERADRNGTANPLIAEGMPTAGTGIRHTLAFGVSQSGRFLRHFLELGMNDDGHGRRVIDGVMSHVARRQGVRHGRRGFLRSIAFLHSLTTEGPALRGNPGVARGGGMNKQLLQRRAVGPTPAKPVFRKRRRLALATEHQASRRKSSITWGPSRSDRSARAAALPLIEEHRLLWFCCCRSGFGRQSAALSLRWLRLCWGNRAPRGVHSRDTRQRVEDISAVPFTPACDGHPWRR
jgi:hypothetical protein